MISSELTDRDGDALTITTDDRGTWLTCGSGALEVTVGPFLTAALGSLLALEPVSGTGAHPAAAG